MPMPVEYQRATDHSHQFFADARDEANLGSVHQAYTMAQSVFQVFRRRLNIEDAIRFANILPAGLRALFVADWNAEEPKVPFEDRAVMTKEVQSLRPLHNFSPESSIRDVAVALRRNMDAAKLDRVLAKLPGAARRRFSLLIALAVFAALALAVQASAQRIIALDVHGAGTGAGQGTWAYCANIGEMVLGYYTESSGVYRGFLRTPEGRLTTFDAPLEGSAPGQGTQVYGVDPTAGALAITLMPKETTTALFGILKETSSDSMS